MFFQHEKTCRTGIVRSIDGFVDCFYNEDRKDQEGEADE